MTLLGNVVVIGLLVWLIYLSLRPKKKRRKEARADRKAREEAHRLTLRDRWEVFREVNDLEKSINRPTVEPDRSGYVRKRRDEEGAGV